tara:strand:- start:356 stop:2485 length:2130 start_codon:yes stop_codon:yes gene_type:complete
MTIDFGIDLEDAISELQSEVEDALNFMQSEFSDQWGRAERYYAGDCDLPSAPGRSDAVKSEVRDIIRAAMPSIMRVLLQSRKPVEYIPSNIKHAAFIEQQGLFVNQLFNASGGYKVLYNCVMQAAKLKVGPIKTWWESDPMPRYFEMNGLSEEEAEGLKQSPDIEVLTVESSPKLGGLFDVTGRKYEDSGTIQIEDFPVYEFFVSRNATNLETARVHGHHRAATVAEAIEMGLEYDGDWSELTGTDPEVESNSAAATARRGYHPDGDEQASADPMQQKILLTEVYCKFDLDGDGIEKRYCFMLGGVSHEYITHYEIEDYCIDLPCLDPQPYTVIGRSLADITIEMQDNNTSILRAIIDNAHMANNPRYAADPTTTDFNDLMNNAIGAPIKTRGAPAVQVVDIPFTGGALIPFLEYLEKDTEERVGITKAATGLDPDALQSTDKDAVLNTIQLSQGQIELMARNIVESGLIGVFRKMLRLSMRHMDKMQVIRTKGTIVPMDITMFDPSLAAEPNVGLGTANHEAKMATLNFVLQKQEQLIQQMGMDNPFTSLSQLYNTLEDIVEIGGLKDPGRYFSIVTKEMEAQIIRSKNEAEAKAAAEQVPPKDPTEALLEIEMMKSKDRQLKITADTKSKELEVSATARAKELTLQLEALRDAESIDVKRDQMIQDRVIELRKINADKENARIAKEQAANDGARESAANESRREPTK